MSKRTVKKEKNINASKIYSLVSNLAERTKLPGTCHFHNIEVARSILRNSLLKYGATRKFHTGAVMDL